MHNNITLLYLEHHFSSEANVFSVKQYINSLGSVSLYFTTLKSQTANTYTDNTLPSVTDKYKIHHPLLLQTPSETSLPTFILSRCSSLIATTLIFPLFSTIHRSNNFSSSRTARFPSYNLLNKIVTFDNTGKENTVYVTTIGDSENHNIFSMEDRVITANTYHFAYSTILMESTPFTLLGIYCIKKIQL